MPHERPLRALRLCKTAWMFFLPHPKTPRSPALFGAAPPQASQEDPRFLHPVARRQEALYRLWQQGTLLTAGSISETSPPSTEPPPQDQLLFLAKHFHPLWRWLYAILNAWKIWQWPGLLQGLWHTRGLPRTVFEGSREQELAYDAFDSPLVRAQPLVSVILPTLNRYALLAEVLRDLEAQTHRNLEVIVVDQSQPFRPEFYEAFDLPLHLIRQEEPMLWQARNRAIRAAKGEYCLFFDDDSRVEPDWVAQHLKCLDFFQADISAGISLSAIGAKVPANYRYFRWSDQFDTGNAMVKREVFQQTGLFDRQFERMRSGDGEFGWRCFQHGLRNVNNPRAGRLHLKAESGGLRQHGHWDGWRPKNWWAPRPVPSILYLQRRYFGNGVALRSLALGLIPSLVPYAQKGRLGAMIKGLLFALPLLPFLLIQAGRSWRISSRLVKEGPKIDPLSSKFE